MQLEHLQIHEVAELLGQFSCEKSEMSAKHTALCAGTYNRTCQRAVAQVEIRNVATNLADVRSEREARCVARERNAYALCLHANNFKRQFSYAGKRE